MQLRLQGLTITGISVLTIAKTSHCLHCFQIIFRDFRSDVIALTFTLVIISK